MPAGVGAFPPGFYPGPDDPLVSATFGDWWTRSFRLLTTTWRPILMVQLCWLIPMLVLSVASGLLETDTVDSTTDGSEILRVLALALPTALISLLLSSVAQLASLHVVVQRATGQQVSVRAALLAGLRRIHAMLGWGILAVLLIGVGLLLCILPGIYVTLVLFSLPAIVLLERNQGIGRAFELFHANVGASLARIATIIGIAFVFGVVESAFSGLLSNGSSTPATPTIAVLGAVVSTIFSLVISIIVAPLMLTAYADMRARREPFSTAYLMPAQPAHTQPGYPV